MTSGSSQDQVDAGISEYRLRQLTNFQSKPNNSTCTINTPVPISHAWNDNYSNAGNIDHHVTPLTFRYTVQWAFQGNDFDMNYPVPALMENKLRVLNCQKLSMKSNG